MMWSKTFGVIELLPDGTAAFIDNNWAQNQDESQAKVFSTKQEAQEFISLLQGTYQVKTFLQEIS